MSSWLQATSRDPDSSKILKSTDAKIEKGLMLIGAKGLLVISVLRLRSIDLYDWKHTVASALFATLSLLLILVALGPPI